MKQEYHLFDRPENVKRLLLGFYAFLALLVITDFFVDKHPEFPWEGASQFFAVYGFVSCVLLIFVAKILRMFIKREEDYYDSADDQSPAPPNS